MRAIAELERTRAGLLQIGSVVSVDLSDPTAPRAVVRLDGVDSAPLPWLTWRAGNNRAFAAPSVGEQVVIACPNGDPGNGLILGALYCADAPAPANTDTVTRLQFEDGAVLDYDTEAHALRASLPDGGTAEITAPGGITLTGDVTIEGDVTVAGNVDADGDVKAGAISLSGHAHGGVQTGAGVTGQPQ